MNRYDRLPIGLSETKMEKQKQLVLPLVGKLKNRTILAAAVLLVVSGTFAAIVRADSYQQQIDSLNTQNTQNQSTLGGLQLQANSYQSAISLLQQQISGIQAAITANQAEQADIQQQITSDQAQLAQEKVAMGDDIEAMYVNGQMTTVEMLATSKSLSNFVDAETYRNAVQGKIQDELTKISQLEGQLEVQQVQVSKLLSSQQQQESTLSLAESQQNNLLAMDQGQQDTYTQQIQANNARISQLQAEQAAAERAAFSGSSSATGGVVTYQNLTSQILCGGGYSFHCADQQDGWFDQWGEYNRECVSYVAWYEANQGHYVPAFGDTYYNDGPQGDAYQWHGVIANTDTASIIYYDQALANERALAGDVVYMPIGDLGHVGVVLSDDGNGWVHVGQYNLYDEGMYSEMDLKITPNLEFYQFH